MVALATALTDALTALHRMSGEEVVAAFPKEMTTGLDLKEFAEIIARYKESLYPDSVRIDPAAASRVEQSLKAGGLLRPGAGMAGLLDLSVVGG